MAFKKVKKKDSFGQWFVDKFGVDELNYLLKDERNKNLSKKVWEISIGSDVKIWFKCKDRNYHEYCMSVNNYTSGCRCKYCARTKYVHPLDSVGQYITENFGKDFLNTIWSTDNIKSAFKYSTGTESKVILNCPCGVHKPTLRQVKNSVRSDFRCPECVANDNTSKLARKVNQYIVGLGYKINSEHKCTIRPINPKTKMPMPFDFEIEDLKLVIEVHGGQHYNILSGNSKWLDGLTGEEYLRYRKIKDRYKRMFAKSKGYNYIEIPYWCDDNEQSWKEIINNKINEIDKGTTTEAQ